MVTLIPLFTSHINASFALIGSLQGIQIPPDASCSSRPRCLRFMSSKSPVRTPSPPAEKRWGRRALDEVQGADDSSETVRNAGYTRASEQAPSLLLPARCRHRVG